MIFDVMRMLEKRNLRKSGVKGLFTLASVQSKTLGRRGKECSPSPEPGVQGIEKQLVASVSVLLPASQFIVDGQGHALLETFASPGGKSDDVPVRLEFERHFEIFRDVVLGPELLVAVLVEVTDLLDSCPAEDGVVANERSHVAVADGVFDSCVDEIGEERLSVVSLPSETEERGLETYDAVLEVCPGHVHNTRRKLHDADFRRLLHLAHSVQ